ncbi:hypothetical protein OAS39_12725 [Pirellulales bacterium]|nr:hypothetical protein [Pirellulales bacterium]
MPTQPNEPLDPRHAIAQRMLQRANADLAKEEARDPHRPPASDLGVGPLMPIAELRPRIDPSVIAHGAMLALGITFALLALATCYHLMNMMFIAGRALALPAGLILAASVSYASTLYLNIIESTSNGQTTVENALDGGWQEWFWTLPNTLGMVAVAAFAAWGLALLIPDHTTMTTIAAITIIYPVAQLSSLENASLSPISLPVIRTLMTRPLAWWIFFAASVLLFTGIVTLAKLSWRDPPYVTMLIMGPATTSALLVYSWMLGTLARALSGTRTQ